MNLSRTLIAMAMAAAPVWAWAGGKAVVEGGTGGDKARMTYEFDGDLLRMDVPDQPDGYMIMRDGKIYSVAQQNGQPMVIDMAGMGKMLGGMAQRSMANIDQDVDQFISLEDTGRTETIAGIKGRVHVRSRLQERLNRPHERLDSRMRGLD